MAKAKPKNDTSKGLEVVNAEVITESETTEFSNAEQASYSEAEYRHMESANGSESLSLTMEAELFSGLRSDFNFTLQKLLEKVTSRNIDEGEVNLKLTITLQEQNVLKKTVMVPTFKHVVTGNYKEKIESKGSFGVPHTYLAKNKDGDYELKSLEDNLFESGPVDAEVREAENE